VVIFIDMLKLPPDPLERNGGWPGLVRGTPVYTNRTAAGVGIGFFPGPHLPVRFKPTRWFGEDFGKGVDVMEMSGHLRMLVDEKTNTWSEQDWEFCVNDVVLEVTEGDGDAGVDLEETLSSQDEGTGRGREYVLVRENGQVEIHPFGSGDGRHSEDFDRWTQQLQFIGTKARV
jgi:hypothetical protein